MTRPHSIHCWLFHKWGAWKRIPCQGATIQERICSRCNYMQTEIVCWLGRNGEEGSST